MNRRELIVDSPPDIDSTNQGFSIKTKLKWTITCIFIVRKPTDDIINQNTEYRQWEYPISSRNSIKEGFESGFPVRQVDAVKYQA